MMSPGRCTELLAFTLDNGGQRDPGAPDYGSAYGTSFAAPVVSGVLSLMLSVEPALTAQQLVDGLRLSSRPHVGSPTLPACSDQNPGRCLCSTATCGAGMLNAPAAVAAAQYPIASLTTSTDRASLGETVTLDGTSSAAATGYSLAYQWKADPDVSIANASSAVAKLVFPALRPVTVTLTVRDGAGRQDSVSKTLDSVAEKAGGSGGGGFDDTALGWLAGIALLAITARRRRQGAIDRAAG